VPTLHAIKAVFLTSTLRNLALATASRAISPLNVIRANVKTSTSVWILELVPRLATILWGLSNALASVDLNCPGTTLLAHSLVCFAIFQIRLLLVSLVLKKYVVNLQTMKACLCSLLILVFEPWKWESH
jgi:hypothetical protein